MGIQIKNNASGTLATAINASDTGIVLTTGNGANFPVLGLGDYFYATLESTGGTFEVIRVTARSGDSMTVLRAQEGSIANSFAAGSRIELRVTAQSVADIAQLYASDADISLRNDLAAPSGSSIVGFQQAGLGTVLRETQAKLRETVSVKDFGTGNNDAAFQAAIDSLPSNGGMVVVPSGNYTFTSTVNLRNGVYVMGMGGRDGVRITANGITAFQSLNNQQVRIENLRLFSNRTPGTWGIYVYNNPRGIHLQNIYVDGFGERLNGGAYYLELECWGSRLIGLAAERCGYGIRLNGASASVIIAPAIRQLSGPGLFIESGTSYEVIGGVIEKTWPANGAVAGTGYSIIVSADRVGIRGVYTEQSIDGLVKLLNCNNVTVENCFIDGFNGSIVDGLVSVNNSRNCTIRNNSIRGLSSSVTGKSNIYIGTTSTFNLIENNFLESDGALGAGNFNIQNLGANNTVFVNSGSDVNSQSQNGLRLPGQPIAAGSIALTSSASVRLDQAGVGPTILLQNGFNSAALGTGSAIHFRGITSGRQYTVRSSSAGTFTRSPDLIFESDNDSGGVVRRVVMRNGGELRPGVDNAYPLGSGSFRWSEVFAGAPAINTSDAREKQDIESIREAEFRVAKQIKSLVKRFRFKTAVAKKGAAARIHFGVIAQEIAQAFESEGLDPHHYALFCYDEWHEVDGQFVDPDENGEYPDNAIKKSRYGIRYEELFAFVISAM